MSDAFDNIQPSSANWLSGKVGGGQRLTSQVNFPLLTNRLRHLELRVKEGRMSASCKPFKTSCIGVLDTFLKKIFHSVRLPYYRYLRKIVI